MDPKQSTVPVESGRDPEGCPKVVDGPLRLALGVVYVAEKAITFAGGELIAIVREEIDCM